MPHLSDVFGEQRRYKRVINSFRHAKLLAESWETVMGDLANVMWFSYLKGDVLSLETDNHTWVTEVSFYEDTILAAVNRFFEQSGVAATVKKLRIKHGVRPEITASERFSSGRKRYPLADEVSTEALLKKIRLKNKARQVAGQVLCRRCGLVYTREVFCGSCRAQTSILDTKKEL